MIGFIVGVFIGMFAGLMLAALLGANGRDHDQEIYESYHDGFIAGQNWHQK